MSHLQRVTKEQAVKLLLHASMVIVNGKMDPISWVLEHEKTKSNTEITVKLATPSYKDVILMYLKENSYSVNEYGDILKISWQQ